jgi:hypothetical protein
MARAHFSRCGVARALRYSCLSNLHVLPGIPQRDGHEFAGLAVGEKVEAAEPGLLADGRKLFPSEVDDAIEALGFGLAPHTVGFELLDLPPRRFGGGVGSAAICAKNCSAKGLLALKALN